MAFHLHEKYYSRLMQTFQARYIPQFTVMHRQSNVILNDGVDDLRTIHQATFEYWDECSNA